MAFLDYNNDGWLDVYLTNCPTVESSKAKTDSFRTGFIVITETGLSRMSRMSPVWTFEVGQWA